MTSPYLSRFLTRLFTLALLSCAQAAFAKVNLDVLQADGYGMAEIKRPNPNTLTVVAEINGRKLRLIVDTGLQPGGIFLHNDLMSSLRVSTQDIKASLKSASGREMTGFKGATAERVRIGNVELAGGATFWKPKIPPLW